MGKSIVNTIIQGDCLELFKRMPDKSVDYVITSPPYNQPRWDKYSHFDDSFSDYYKWLVRVVDNCVRVSRKHVFFNIQTTYATRPDIYKLIGHYNKQIQQLIIWTKENSTPSAGGNVSNAYEFILVLGDKVLHSNCQFTKNVITTRGWNNEFSDVHKAVMNPQVCRWMIETFTQPDEIILDPFMGVGTTAYCAKQLKRKFVGFELSKEYIEIANKRIENSFKLKASPKGLFVR